MASKRRNTNDPGTVGARVEHARRLKFGTLGENDAEWSACDPAWIQGVVVEITRLGGAAIFGKTRDGGALTLTIILDSEKEHFYIKPYEDLNVALAGVYESLKDTH